MESKLTDGDVKDPSLANEGVNKILWSARDMPVIGLIRERFAKERPLEGVRVSGCLHITSETANLALAMRDGGAQVALCASNPLSTQDDVAAALVGEYGIPTFAIKGEDSDTFYRHINSALNQGPQVTLDDGADLVTTLHKDRQELMGGVIGGTEETTTGVIRLQAMSGEGRLRYPVIAVNEAKTKHFFDNRYGTGQSTLDGITRATNMLWAGRNVVVVGYGWCGRGVASRAKGMGAHVTIAEVDPVKALEAIMDGFTVKHSVEAARTGEMFITVTGGLKSIGRQHLEVMRDGAVLANSGHFNVEIDIPALEEMAEEKSQVRPFVDEYRLKDGRRLYLLAEGRLINLSAAEGHPSSVMDMSFANQALCVEFLVKSKENLGAEVYPVPKEIDADVGRLKLHSMGVEIDTLSAEQQRYLESWEEGT